MKINREKFLTLALSMGLTQSGACVIRDPAAPPLNAPAANTSAPASAEDPAPAPDPVYNEPFEGPEYGVDTAAPADECVEWNPSGECIGWGGDNSMLPADECVQWDPSGECIGWAGDTVAPTDECVEWNPSGECTRWM